MKCEHWVSKDGGCTHFGLVSCEGKDMECNIIEKPDKPTTPVPRFCYDELKAQNAELLAACKAWLLWDSEVYAAKETGESEYSYGELQALRQDAEARTRAAIAKCEAHILTGNATRTWR